MDAADELERTGAGGAVTVDGQERTILAVATFQELYQRAGSAAWIRQGKVSRALWLAGDRLILRLPSRDGGEYLWLLADPTRADTDLRAFYRGGDSAESWGPARRFARGGQGTPVPYQLLGLEWRVVDVGAWEAEVDGRCGFAQTGDRIYTVTSQGADGWLVYLDARTGEARGTGGLFRGAEFQPDEQVEALL